MAETKVEVDGLKKYFAADDSLLSRLRKDQTMVKAVDGISFEIESGTSLGIAGESGCGKTTAGETIVRLHEPTGGRILFDGKEINDIDGEELKAFRREAQIIFQDPYESLNPRFTVGRWIREPLNIHGVGTRETRDDQVHEVLEQVGLDPASDYVDKHPPSLSGGERQRVAIARALVLEPSFILGDEPASMLDVSIRAKILDLFKRLEDEFDITSLYISHDLALLKYICDDIAIMYLGKIVEMGPAERIINDPKHPYTQALVGSMPRIAGEGRADSHVLRGQVPDPTDIPNYCRFYDRCPKAMDECTVEEPPLYEVGDGQQARCILYE